MCIMTSNHMDKKCYSLVSDSVYVCDKLSVRQFYDTHIKKI